MPVPIILLLGAAAAVAAAASSAKPKKKTIATPTSSMLEGLIAPGLQSTPSPPKPTGPLELSPSGVVALQQGNPAVFDPILASYGYAPPNDYPAPYDWASTQVVADFVLAAANESAPAVRVHFDHVVAKYTAIKASSMPADHRVLATIWEVIIPTLAQNLLWWWYRPRTKEKQAQLAAVGMWIGYFFVGPLTATAPTTTTELESGQPVFDLLSGNPRLVYPVQRGLSVNQQRRVLLDVHWQLRSYQCRVLPDGSAKKWYCAMGESEGVRIVAIQNRAPLTDPNLGMLGNLEIIGEIARVPLVIAEDEIDAPDTDDMLVGLVLNIIAAVVLAVAPVAAGAIAAAAAALGGIAASAATAVGLTTAITAGISTSVAAAVQAGVGAGIAYLLSQTGVAKEIGASENIAAVAGAVAAKA